MSASEEELECSDANSVDSQWSSSPEFETEEESDGPSVDLLMSDGEEDAACGSICGRTASRRRMDDRV